MLVKDAMTHRAESIGPDETVEAAAQKMRSLAIGALAVREHQRLIGIITDRDIVVRCVAEGRTPRATVRSAMTPQVFYCFEEDTLDHAAQMMEERCVRRLLVLDGQRRLSGLVSADDLALVARGLAADVIERVRDPGRLHEPDWLPIQ